MQHENSTIRRSRNWTILNVQSVLNTLIDIRGTSIAALMLAPEGEKVLGTLQLVGFSDEIISEKFLEIQERVFSVPIIDNDKGTAMYRTLRLPAQKLVFAPGLKGYPVVLEIVE